MLKVLLRYLQYFFTFQVLNPNDEVPYEIYEVAPPTKDYGLPVATQLLVDYIFDSWGHPAVVEFTSPTVNYTHVKLTVEWESSGIQYDRLAHVYLDSVEVWRPSTPEPGNDEIYSEFTVDASEFVNLFKSASRLVMACDNIVQGRLTGAISARLKAEYFYAPDKIGGWYYESLPTHVKSLTKEIDRFPPAVQMKIPQLSRSTTRAALRLIASGNAAEEFWYADEEQPTRFVSLYIDDLLAGDLSPYPTVYTGAFQPRLWRPLVPIRAYDVPANIVDISPFLPLLWGNGTSSLRIEVNAVRSDWILSVSLLTWETPGIYGEGVTYPPVIDRAPPVDIRLPGVHIITAARSLNCSADLVFTNSRTNVTEPRHIEWLQNSNQDIIQTHRATRDLYTMSTAGRTELITDNSPSHSMEFEYSKVLVLTDTDVVVAQEYNVSTLNNSIQVSQNATWGSGQEINGTDVFGVQMDPAWSTHVTSRDGIIVGLESPTYPTHAFQGSDFGNSMKELMLLRDSDQDVRRSSSRASRWMTKKLMN